MEEEKNWIVVPTWRIPDRLEKWHSLVKHLKHRTRELQQVSYVPHHKVGWAWWTCSRVIFPLNKGAWLEIQGYWNLTPERGFLSSYAVRLTWYEENFYTDVTPDVADQLLHGTYFSCFTANEVRRAIRGEKILSYCNYPSAHERQVPSLQFLALRVVQEGKNGSKGEGATRKQRRRDNRRGIRLARKNNNRAQQGSGQPFTPGTHFPGLAEVLGILA
ncbi:vif protein [Human immunodeficiency virus 2]|uniref:Virion infectivity factor n=1 Tax=Human immunodeficiency virus 2 TaxID=11709 RepID=L8B2K8_9HIV2|nr:vif protein [Human immunodeficiency virus 2]BAM76165.1 vif protein [Human immunodeficiency virus 2]